MIFTFVILKKLKKQLAECESLSLLLTILVNDILLSLYQPVWSASPAVGQIQRVDKSPVISCSDTEGRAGSH